ncbi:DUF4178 domain-containing protein [Selenomonas sp. F0473]|uniref:DUF4178 domain-containing protein n=1 Tax=Selenomonas sp. F0473 TaxID=999423 RepID=UPI00029EC06A|nr:DUF4178 domain-containing protein [Selenomonas sp. F0473]EKU71202.1 hypothetical protein HMPREF9161_01296 [Selenomonas sp. F0473]
MDFDCWTGILVEGKPYTIVEKIRYKEKGSDDRWTEYGLVAEGEASRMWLTVEGDNLACTLSRTAHRSTAPQGYALRDKGEQVVTGVWGDTDASVGDTASYRQYRHVDGKRFFFIESWKGGTQDAAEGHSVKPGDIRLDPEVSETRVGAMKWSARKKRFMNGLSQSVTVLGVGLFFFFMIDEMPDIGTWHDLRRLAGMPYAMEERVEDAPYESKEHSADGAKVYDVDTDAGTAALDLIEGIDGRIMEGHTELSLPAHPFVLRTVQEEARITAASAGTARIACAPRGADDTPAQEKLKRDYTLARYAEVVRTGDVRGRSVVVRP